MIFISKEVELVRDIVSCRQHLWPEFWPCSVVGRLLRCELQLRIEDENRGLSGLNPVLMKRRLSLAERQLF